MGGVTAAGTGFERDVGGAWWAGASYAANRALAVRAGYGSTAFGCKEAFCRESATTFTSNGLDLGVRLSWSRLWIQGAVVRHSLSAAWGEGESEKTTSSFGWEASGGVGLPLGNRVSFTPGVRYGAHRARFPGGDEEDGVGYLALDVGLGIGVWAGP